ncbi:hypothetical protein ANN_24420 [Periplaneta americana]|uniref:Uncharacterized protein n=1 Tax=Periplaneta americana TaxID=6978 RepID=A0ABQ8S3S2_PERAM|nr:hypothetical protein ANN_24420 [Periplaneta americana]
MAGLREGGNEPPGSLKASKFKFFLWNNVIVEWEYPSTLKTLNSCTYESRAGPSFAEYETESYLRQIFIWMTMNPFRCILMVFGLQ